MQQKTCMFLCLYIHILQILKKIFFYFFLGCSTAIEMYSKCTVQYCTLYCKICIQQLLLNYKQPGRKRPRLLNYKYNHDRYPWLQGQCREIFTPSFYSKIRGLKDKCHYRQIWRFISGGVALSLNNSSQSGKHFCDTP